MAATKGKTTARTQKHVDPLDALEAALQSSQAGQGSQSKSSSETKTFAPHQAGAVNTNQPLHTARKLDEEGNPMPLTMQEYIDEQARIRFAGNAAIEAAMDLAFGTVTRMPTSEEIVAKQRISMTPDLWDEAMGRITHGQSMAKVCRLSHMPSVTSFHRYMDNNPEAAKQYQTAVFTRTDNQVEQITELSAEMKRKSAMGASREEIDALKVLINSIQWTAARINPGKYGDKLNLDVKDERLSETQVTERLLVLQRRAAERATKQDDEADTNS
jgi:hypothetical protein